MTTISKQLAHYECEALRFANRTDNEDYDRHLVFDHVVLPEEVSQRERFEAVSRSLRDLLTQRWHYENGPEITPALDLIFGDHFSSDEPGIFLDHGDYFGHLANLTSYSQAQQKVGELYGDPEAWTRKSILNVAASGKFSSDRTVAEYAVGIWNAVPCPVD